MQDRVGTAAATQCRSGIAGAEQRTGNWLAALRRYLGVIAVGNLLWEFAHMPLYTIWWTGTWGEIVFAVLHCTGGDILIALSSLMLALLVTGRGRWPRERFQSVAAITLLLGLAYTAISEWLNIVVRAAWAYSDLMPVVSVLGFEVGLSPLLQWIAVPLLAFWVVGRHAEVSTARMPWSA
jgi:hypothetical protein